MLRFDLLVLEVFVEFRVVDLHHAVELVEFESHLIEVAVEHVGKVFDDGVLEDGVDALGTEVEFEEVLAEVVHPLEVADLVVVEGEEFEDLLEFGFEGRFPVE